MHGADVGEPASRRNHGKRSSRLPPEEEQPRVLPGRFRLLLGVGVDVVEDRSTGARVIDHSIERRDDDGGVYMGVVRE